MLPKIDEHSLSLPSFRIAANGSGPKWLPMTSSSASPELIPTDVFMDSGLLALRLEPESRLRILHKGEFVVAAVGHQHGAGIMHNHNTEFRPRGHDHWLRRHSAGPEDRNFIVVHEIPDADHFRLGNWTGAPCTEGNRLCDLEGADRVSLASSAAWTRPEVRFRPRLPILSLSKLGKSRPAATMLHARLRRFVAGGLSNPVETTVKIAFANGTDHSPKAR